jgi:NADP-dependent 3-hydroxy acid dehydrogenase YdfG
VIPLVGQHARVRELAGAVVVVVGATGVLGSAICDELLDRRVIVLGASRHGPDIHLDLRDSRAGDAVVRAALGTQGRLDGVINAAGLVSSGDLVDTDDVVIEELFLTNALGPLWMARRLLPALATGAGFFANVTGAAAEQSTSGNVAHGASTAALAHAMVGLRAEAQRTGVDVIDLRPPRGDPESVARRIVQAIAAREPDVAAAAFAAG